MLPLKAIPHQFTLHVAMQSYLDVVIPANTWAFNRLLIVTGFINLEVVVPNQLPNPLYLEEYHVTAAGRAPRGALTNVTHVPSSNSFRIVRTFMLHPAGGISELNWDVAKNFSVSDPDGIDHNLALAWTIAQFDPTIDNVLEFRLATTWPTSLDTIETVQAEAFIQAPYTLRRIG